MKRTLVIVLLGSAGIFGVLTASALSAATATPSGGRIEIWETPGATPGAGTVVVTGAIGDYGKTSGKRLENGTSNKNGTYGLITLQKGTFEADLANIGKVINNASPTVNSTTTCSFVISGSAPVPLLNGTGLYKGIRGTVQVTETFAGILPRVTSGKDKGQCNESNRAGAVAEWGSVTGIGTVNFT